MYENCELLTRYAISYRRFGTDCSETSVRNYHYSLRNNPEERSSYLLRGGSLNSRVFPLRRFLCSHVLIVVVFEINGGVGGSGVDDVYNYPNLFTIWRLICVARG